MDMWAYIYLVITKNVYLEAQAKKCKRKYRDIRCFPNVQTLGKQKKRKEDWPKSHYTTELINQHVN